MKTCLILLEVHFQPTIQKSDKSPSRILSMVMTLLQEFGTVKKKKRGKNQQLKTMKPLNHYKRYDILWQDQYEKVTKVLRHNITQKAGMIFSKEPSSELKTKLRI